MNQYMCVWLFLLTMIVLSSCDKFLDRQPDNMITEEVVFTDFTRTNGLVSSIYRRLGDYDKGCVMLNHFSISCITDECKGSMVESDLANRITQGQYGPSSISQFQFWWFFNYEAIRDCNVFLEGVAKHNTPDNPKRPGDLEIRIGEVYFMRAYWHFNILRFFGDMLYMDKTADLNDEAELRTWTRISGVDAIDKMIADLDEAIRRLPLRQPDAEFGRVEKGAAMALKARLLWIRALPLWNGGGPEGITFNGWNERVDNHLYASYDPTWWGKAAEAAKEVLDLTENGQPRYHLFTRYGDTEYTAGSLSLNNRSNVNHRVYQRIMKLFWDQDAYQNEFIFLLMNNKPEGWQPDQTPISNGGGFRSQPLQDQADEYEFIYNGYGYPIYHENAAAMGYDDGDPYRDRDPRFYAHYVYHGSTFQNTDIHQSCTDPLITDRASNSVDRIGAGGNSANRTGYGLRKCLQDDWTRGIGNWDNQWPLIRLPEIILIYCESVCRSTGVTPEIVGLVNALRARSFMAPIPPEAGSNADIFLDYVLRERRVELFYENVRYFETRWRLEPSSPTELAKQAAYDAKSGQAKADSYPYPRTQKQIHGMEPVRDDNGKMTVDGVRYRMQRFQIEGRWANVPQMYFLPIDQTEITNMPTIKQNPGW